MRSYVSLKEMNVIEVYENHKRTAEMKSNKK